ncbi:MAG: hypothetical protein IKA64_01310 [Clostridia bacterium]|nr:hypothetical protein [Clostridia bacterium]
MKRLFSVLLTLTLSFSFLFSAVGFAAISDRLTVEGSASANPPEGLVILSVVSNSPGAVTNYYASTVHSSTVDLTGVNSVSFTITVFNNTGYTYYFDEAVWQDNAYDNTGIQLSLSGIAAKYELVDKATVTFTAIFTCKNSSVTNKVLNSVINYQFVPNAEDAGDIAIDNALGKFQEILNDDALGGAFEVLIDNMDDSGRRANETYIGNVVGADSEDTNAIKGLFTDGIMDYLVLQIGDGDKKSVTAIIKREPLDGRDDTGTDIVNSSGAVKTAGCEMTIYLTPDDIPADRLLFGSGGSTITVYAAVFTTDEDGNWYQLSPLYEGTATTNNYDGNTLFATANSFNTDTWRSVAASYETDKGTVVVKKGDTIATLVSALPD